ncbi:MAG: phage head closure protein [Mammaliicoccus sciuri]
MAYHFNTRILIFKEVSTSPYPDDPVEEIEVAKLWADIKTMKGEEYLIWKTTANKELIRFIIRYREGINARMKVKYAGKDYNITSVSNDNGRNETLTIYAYTVDE